MEMNRLKEISALLVVVMALLYVPRPAFSFTVSNAAAVESASDSVTLDELIEEALKNNPRIKSAKYRWGASIERIPQVGSLPDPMFSMTHFVEPIETRLGPNNRRYMLSQKVPYPKKLDLKEEIAAADARVYQIKYKKSVREVISELSESYFELIYIQKALDITKQNKNLLDQLTKIGAADYAAESATLNDVLTAQSQLAQLNYDHLLLQELRETETVRIASIVNRPLERPITAVEDVRLELDHDLPDLYKIMENNHEELKIIDANIAKAKRGEELAELSSYPDFKFEILYSEIGDPDVDAMMRPDDAGRDAYGVTVGISLPLWAEKNSSAVREKVLMRKVLMEKRNDRVNMTRSKIKGLYFKMNNAKRLMELYSKTLIPQAQTTMEKAELWYKEKNAAFSQLLETQSVWLNFNLAYHRAIADYNKYAVKMQNLLGIELTYKDADEAEGK